MEPVLAYKKYTRRNQVQMTRFGSHIASKLQRKLCIETPSGTPSYAVYITGLCHQLCMSTDDIIFGRGSEQRT